MFLSTSEVSERTLSWDIGYTCNRVKENPVLERVTLGRGQRVRSGWGQE